MSSHCVSRACLTLGNGGKWWLAALTDDNYVAWNKTRVIFQIGVGMAMNDADVINGVSMSGRLGGNYCLHSFL